MSWAPLAEKQRKSLLRGVFRFMTTGREHRPLIGLYVRVPHYRFSELRSSGTSSSDNMSEGQSCRWKPQRLGCQTKTLPKLVGNRSFSEIVLFSPVIASCLDCGWGVCKRNPSCLRLHGYGHVICSSLSQAIDRDASAFKTWVYWKWDLHSCQKWMLFCVHHYHTSWFFFFLILTLKTIISNNSRGKKLNISIWRAD